MDWGNLAKKATIGAVTGTTGLIANEIYDQINRNAENPGGVAPATTDRQKLQEDIRKRQESRQQELRQGIAGMSTGPYRNPDQDRLISTLLAQSRGEGPSAAQAQLQQATDQNMRQALAYAASSRGNPALAQQAAGRQRAQMSQQAVAQSAALRAQEQAAAQGLTQQAIMGRVSAAQAEQAQQDLMRRFYETGISESLGRQTQAQLGIEGLTSQEFQAGRQLESAERQAKAQRDAQILSGILGAGASVGAAAAASDKNVKKNISNLDPQALDEFFNAVKGKSFTYKKPGSPGQTAGDKVGFLAQDVKDTKLGKKLVSEGENGLQYDPQVLDGIMLAAIEKLYKQRGNSNAA